MPIKLNTYLNFNGQAREAMEFYKSVFGGELTLSTFKEFQGSTEAADADKIMHAALETSSGLSLMAADTPASMEYHPASAFALSLSGDEADEATLCGYFDQLSAGGKVTMPLEKAMWGDTFGMLDDKFGISWMVNIAGPKPE